MATSGTYVYCLVAGRSLPPLKRRAAQLPGLGPLRLLEVDRGLWLVVADAPLSQYGEEAINGRLSDLDWVSRAAVRHEAIVESFAEQMTVLPMKLFTIFTSDERALNHVRAERKRIDALVNRVAKHDEWGVRVTLDRAGMRQAASEARKTSQGRSKSSRQAGRSYLSQKKAQRDAAIELAEHARETVLELFDRLASQASLARRRSASELPRQDGPLLLDAAFLVARTRAARFRALAAREARALERGGYHVSLSGPWPPYTFVKD
jgi:hypothetical protein